LDPEVDKAFRGIEAKSKAPYHEETKDVSTPKLTKQAASEVKKLGKGTPRLK
jgi:hypothetical protein